MAPPAAEGPIGESEGSHTLVDGGMGHALGQSHVVVGESDWMMDFYEAWGGSRVDKQDSLYVEKAPASSTAMLYEPTIVVESELGAPPIATSSILDHGTAMRQLGSSGGLAAPAAGRDLLAGPYKASQAGWPLDPGTKILANELDIMWKLRHPNILRLYGAHLRDDIGASSFTCDGQATGPIVSGKHFLVQELCIGGSLAQKLYPKGALPEWLPLVDVLKVGY